MKQNDLTKRDTDFDQWYDAIIADYSKPFTAYGNMVGIIGIPRMLEEVCGPKHVTCHPPEQIDKYRREMRETFVRLYERGMSVEDAIIEMI